MHITRFLHHSNENTAEIPRSQLISTPRSAVISLSINAASVRSAVNVSHAAAHSAASQATPCTYSRNMLNETPLSFRGIYLRAEAGSAVSEILPE